NTHLQKPPCIGELDNSFLCFNHASQSIIKIWPQPIHDETHIGVPHHFSFSTVNKICNKMIRHVQMLKRKLLLHQLFEGIPVTITKYGSGSQNMQWPRSEKIYKQFASVKL